MNISEINTGIELICKTSKDIREYYEDPEKLIGALNRVPVEEIDKCMEYYSGRSGVVVDLRKEVIEYLSKGKKLNVKILENFINKHRDGKEKQFRAYKQWFAVDPSSRTKNFRFKVCSVLVLLNPDMVARASRKNFSARMGSISSSER